MTGLARRLEALLFLSPEPLSLVGALRARRGAARARRSAPSPSSAERHGPDGGLEVAEVAGGFALRTRADLAEVCDRLRERPPEDRITPAGLETLAVVAYLEPISRPQISRLRGVAADSTVASLVERGLLEEAGRPAEGGAMRYRTTRALPGALRPARPGRPPAARALRAQRARGRARAAPAGRGGPPGGRPGDDGG